MFGIWDHLLVLGVALVWPAYIARRGYPMLLRRVAAGQPRARSNAYRQGVALQWSLVAITLVLWLGQGRPLAELGLGLAWRWQLGAGLGFLILALVFLEAQRRTVAANPATHEMVRAQLAYAEPLLPHDGEEHRLFLGLGITAGICEEILFRGYLMAYGEPWIGMWGSWIATSIVFGAAHIYLGRMAAVRAGLVGLLAGGIYLLTGSLWVSMLLHAAVDVNAGQIARIVLGAPSEEEVRAASSG